jgi:hypothetical protein
MNYSARQTSISLGDIKTGEEINNKETGDKENSNTFLSFSTRWENTGSRMMTGE